MESILELCADFPESTTHMGMANELPFTEHCYVLSTAGHYMCTMSLNPHNKPECRYTSVPILQMRNLEAHRSWAICPNSFCLSRNEVLIIGLSDRFSPP